MNHESTRYAFTFADRAEFLCWLDFDAMRWTYSDLAWQFVVGFSRFDANAGLRRFVSMLRVLRVDDYTRIVGL